MYKLLPKQEVKKVKREYSLRRVSLFLALISAAFIFTAVVLLPSYIFAKEKMEAAQFALSSIGQVPRSADQSALDAWLSRANSYIASVTPEIPADEPYEHFQKIISEKFSDIFIIGLNWTRLANGNKSLKVTGIARSRQAALDFQSRLLKSGDWSQVDLPVGVIAKETNIPFEINLVPTKPK